MASWKLFNGWMCFDRLDRNEGLTQSFTLAYKITDDDTGETWTERFKRFKGKDKSALYGGAALLDAAVPGLLKALDLATTDTVLLPALSSGEASANDTRLLPKLMSRLAERSGTQFDLTSLTKKPHRPIHDIGGASERNAELEKAEYKCGKLKAKSVVIVDDFITQGATLSKIAQAVLASNPSVKVYAIALGKTERRSWLPNISNDHVSTEWDSKWKKGEQIHQGTGTGKN